MGNCGQSSNNEINDRFNTDENIIEQKKTVHLQNPFIEELSYKKRIKLYQILYLKALKPHLKNTQKLLEIYQKFLTEYNSIAILAREYNDYIEFYENCKKNEFSRPNQSEYPFLERLTIKFNKQWFDPEISGAQLISQNIKPVLNHDLKYISLGFDQIDLNDSGVFFLLEYMVYRFRYLEEVRLHFTECGITIQGLINILSQLNNIPFLKKIKLNLPQHNNLFL
ncbi:hypothetical protein PPERSA_04554 [Pseudocohnilembus persalinus]|uniref:Uncharacterized protein n=1 Tax=Pseudocohnilembus persalinus TaxID=266149 RepID=A0A0V0QE86_PSEPJ|nr:hypothetical protein PPERSA_04554 [Pseudocohnilembus persalinus]|eukprot:KRX00533.1 hypothetical protein PPERSA_04554 [Pseudocohnilembus persalinus]